MLCVCLFCKGGRVGIGVLERLFCASTKIKLFRVGLGYDTSGGGVSSELHMLGGSVCSSILFRLVRYFMITPVWKVFLIVRTFAIVMQCLDLQTSMW